MKRRIQDSLYYQLLKRQLIRQRDKGGRLPDFEELNRHIEKSPYDEIGEESPQPEPDKT